MNNPICCGNESRIVIQSTRLKYFYCDECKKEVSETADILSDEEGRDLFERLSSTPLLDQYKDLDKDDGVFWGRGLVTTIDSFNLPNAGLSKNEKYSSDYRWFSLDFQDLHEAFVKRCKIFTLSKSEITISDLILSLQQLPSDATLIGVFNDWIKDTIEFKIRHKSFPVVPEGCEYPKDKFKVN